MLLDKAVEESRQLTLQSREDVGSAQEDDEAADDVVDGEHPEAQTVDDHRNELPVAGDAALFGVVLELAGDPAQFVEDGQQFASQRTQ